MVEAEFTRAAGETVVREAADAHFVRPDASLLGRLCHPCLTERRVVLCEAHYDALRGREKGVGGVLHEFPLSAIESAAAGPDTAEPYILFGVREPGKGYSQLVLYFRDPGWTLGRPERAAERDEWLAAVNVQRERTGLPPLAIVTRRPSPPAPAAAATARDKDPVGSVLAGKYSVLKHIGSGGMGLVYLGRDVSLDRPVAIKRMRPDVTMSGRDKTLFLREAKLSAALHHPFVVDIYAVLEEGDEFYLVFEYVDGKTLQERLDEKGPFKAGALKPVLKCVCEALDYAHAQKVAHRDLKSSNIMLTKQGYGKVMDFGIARQLKDTASRLSKLDTSGTMPYMAPEQELGKFDLRSDVFALGVTVYELLTNELPFRGPNFYLQKERKERRALADLAPDAPGELVAAVERCLEFDPAARFQSVAEFAKAAGVC